MTFKSCIGENSGEVPTPSYGVNEAMSGLTVPPIPIPIIAAAAWLRFCCVPLALVAWYILKPAAPMLGCKNVSGLARVASVDMLAL
jgi:hypothetical protein